MLIYIIRHGQTEWNRIHRLQGRSNVELNENGRALAMETAKGMRDIHFDLAFTSPLARASETAKLVLGDRAVPIIEDERIIEISFGEYEGTPWVLEDGEAGSIPAIYHFFFHPEKYVPAPHGETLEALAARTADFMHDICSRPELAQKTILVSTHGAAMRGLLNSLRTYEPCDFWHKGVAPNCGVAIVECKGGKPVLLQENVVYYERTAYENS